MSGCVDFIVVSKFQFSGDLLTVNTVLIFYQ
jgi:hypothetical protein